MTNIYVLMFACGFIIGLASGEYLGYNRGARDEHSRLTPEERKFCKQKIMGYPEWCCDECGKLHGNRLPNHATYHEAVCDVCGEESFVTEPRDFGHFKNWPT